MGGHERNVKSYNKLCLNMKKKGNVNSVRRKLYYKANTAVYLVFCTNGE